MKKTILLQLCFLTSAFIGMAQSLTTTVTVKENKITLAPRRNAYELPLLLKFDPSNKGKKITLYSDAKGKSILESGTFGAEISPQGGSGGPYVIQIGANKKIPFGGEKKITEPSFYIGIETSELFEVSIKKTETQGPDTNAYKPGYLIYDALQLKKLFLDPGRPSQIEIKRILSFYKITDSVSLNNNKFLKSMFWQEYVEKDTSGSAQGAKDNLLSAASSIGGLDVTNIADGFAKFVVKRTKQELSITFFENFKTELNKYPDLKTLFPQTVNLLDVIDQQIYNYSSYISNLREAFRSDIQTLDENLPGIIDNHQQFFDSRFDLGLALKSGCYISTSLKHNMHPGDILDNYPVNFFYDANGNAKEQKLKGAIQSLQLLSESMKEKDSSNTYWVGMGKIRQLVNDKDALKIYFGLILQVAHNKYQDVRFNDNTTLLGLLNKFDFDANYNDYVAFKQYILTFGSKVNELNTMVVQYANPANDSIKVEQYAKYFKTTIQFLEYCTKASELPYINKSPVKNLSKDLKLYFNVAYETSDLTSSINRKRYPEAINHLLVIYNDVVHKPDSGTKIVASKLTKKQNEDIAKKVVEEHNKNPQAPLSTEQLNAIVNSALLEKDSSTNVLSSLAKYGAFMATVIEAKNSDDVAAAIEAAALPTGSARIKRESSFNVAVNAEAGLFVGYEQIKGVDRCWTKDYQKINSYGITAPIGISISKGHSFLFICTGKYAWSTSLFLSAVDIGAIAAFRFQNDTVAQIPTIQLKDIISPGAFLSIGIPNSPISINIGAQAGPMLRAVGTSTNTYANSSYMRFSASLVVDLPLLNLHTKSRR